MHVVVVRVAVIVLVCTPVGEAKFTQQPRLDEQAERAVDGRPTDGVPGIVDFADQFVRIKMLVRAEDMTHENAPRRGQLLPADLQELTELGLGSLRDQKWGQI